ncbi:MAG: carbohydrate kinase family protein [Nitrososphaerota archaeon]
MAKVLNAGFLCVDFIAAQLPAIPGPGEIVYAPAGIKLRIGGHPANVSVDLMQLGAGRGDVGLACAVGDDVLRDFAVRVLEEKGIVVFLQEVEGEETSKTLTLIVEGEDRRFINDPGANQYLSFSHVLGALEKFKPEIFYIASGILGDFDFKVWELLRYCKERGIVTVLDLVKPVGKSWSYIHPALRFTDIMHCNVLELKGLSGLASVEEGLKWLIDMGVKLPVVSNGEKGVISLCGDKIVRQPAFKVSVVDPSGAGDALCAGIIFKLSETLPRKRFEEISLEDVLELLLFGQAAGAACVEKIGTTPGVTAERVRSLIEEQGERIRRSTLIEG